MAELLVDDRRELRERLRARYGPRNAWNPLGLLPPALVTWLGARLMAVPWFARHVVIDRWFLHTEQPALAAQNP